MPRRDNCTTNSIVNDLVISKLQAPRGPPHTRRSSEAMHCTICSQLLGSTFNCPRTCPSARGVMRRAPGAVCPPDSSQAVLPHLHAREFTIAKRRTAVGLPLMRQWRPWTISSNSSGVCGASTFSGYRLSSSKSALLQRCSTDGQNHPSGQGGGGGGGAMIDMSFVRVSWWMGVCIDSGLQTQEFLNS